MSSRGGVAVAIAAAVGAVFSLTLFASFRKVTNAPAQNADRAKRREESKQREIDTDKNGKDLDIIKSLMKTHLDFPKKGVAFRDVFPVLLNPMAFDMLLTRLTYHVQSTYGQVDRIVGLDSRGFLFGPIMAARLKAGFVPIRKQGKLPGEVHQVAYDKEYGKDTFEIQSDSVTPGQTAIILDDLLATGGTLAAACDLVTQLGGKVLECLVIVELVELEGRAKIPFPVHALLEV